MRRLFGCPDIVSLTEKFLMARNFYRIFTENNPVMGDSKTFGIPEAKGLKHSMAEFQSIQQFGLQLDIIKLWVFVWKMTKITMVEPIISINEISILSW